MAHVPYHSPRTLRLHIASHTLSALSTSASASALSYTQCPYLQPMCKFLPRYLHTFISGARLLLLLPLLLRRRIMIGPAPMGIQIFRTLSYRRMGLKAAAVLNFSQLFFVSRKRDCSGGMYISYSVVSKKNEDFNSCHVCRLFSGLAKKKVSSFFRCVLTRAWVRPQASGFSYDTPMDSVINRHLLQLNVINSQSTESNTVSEKNISTAQFPRVGRHEVTCPVYYY
jgi:hypothetical protein